MTAYYNEIDPYAAQWLRNLISAGHIAPGEVDERSIVDLRASDLERFDQCHFFAGIGGWSVALRLAGWPDDRPVWTGSCPCQPFSAAGAGKAADDKRHLWPAWFPLIAECRPPIVFGEQVEAAIGWGWLDAVFADLEGEGYTCGATVLPACGIGAPHIRQRLWFMAHTDASGRREQRSVELLDRDGTAQRYDADGRRSDVGVADASGKRRGECGELRESQADGIREVSRQGDWLGQPGGGRGAGELADAAGGGFGELGDAPQPGRGGHADGGDGSCELGNPKSGEQRRLWQREQGDRWPSAPGRSGSWGDCEWLACTDGKARPVEPGSFPLAHGIQRRTSKLRAYGNAIVPQVAAEFIGAAIAASGDRSEPSQINANP